MDVDAVVGACRPNRRRGRAAPWRPGRARRRTPGRPRRRWPCAAVRRAGRSSPRATSGRPSSQRPSSSWLEARRVQSVTAVAVAERGPGSNSDSSPNIWPGPRIASRFSRPSADVRPSLTLPSVTTYSRSPASPSWNSTSPRRSLSLGHRGAQRLGGLVVEPREQRSLPQNVVVHAPVLLCRLSAPVEHRQAVTVLRPSAGSVATGTASRAGRRRRRTVRWGHAAAAGRARRRAADRRWCAGPADQPDAGRDLSRRALRARLRHRWELLVATVLSAQTTDKRVNAVTPDPVRPLPRRPPTCRRRPGRRRADHRAHRLLPGQDRVAHEARRRRCSNASTARCPAGSTTLSRCQVSAARPRTSCSATRSACRASPSTPTSGGSPAASAGPSRPTPVKVEHEIGALFPKRDWTMLSHHLIWHGRRCCHARKPACGACPVARLCPSYGEGPTDPHVARLLLRTEGRA